MIAIVFILILLISVNALYVAAEFSTVSARRSRIRQMAQEGNRSAAWLLPFVEDSKNLDRYVAACQIGITLSSLVLGAYGQATLPDHISPLLSDLGGLQEGGAQATSAVVILFGLTGLQVVFGELLPKSVSLQFPTQTALACALPMAVSLRAYSWFIAVLNGSGLAVLRLLGSGEATHRHVHSPEEIELLLVESRDGGLLEPDEQERLRRALSLGEQSVRGLMVPRPRVEMIDSSTPMTAIAEQVTLSRFTRFPVFRDNHDDVIGILHSKDLVRHYIAGDGFPALADILRPPLIMPESLTADRVLNTLREQHSHMGIIVDEFGGFEGIVTLEDLLSEILDVDTSFDQHASEKLPDGRLRVAGSLRLQHTLPWLGETPETEAETIGGLITEILGHLPEPGEIVRINETDIQVEAISERSIASVLIRPNAKAARE